MFEDLDDDDDNDDLAAEADDPLRVWKDHLRADFELWLEGVTTLPEEVDAAAEEELGEGTPSAEPDLYSFYAELAASNAETKKANRRTAEAFSQWGDTLGRFDANLTELQKRLDNRPAEDTGIPKSQLMSLVEMVDRLGRMADAFEIPPPSKRSLFGSTEAWEKAWASQKEANRMLLGHLLGTLQNLGVTRISTQDEPFDPATMAALAAESVPGKPAHQVLEELASGWIYNGKILRPAQVKVSRA